MTEMGKDQLLERFDLVLEVHKIRNRLIADKTKQSPFRISVDRMFIWDSPLIWVINALQANVFLILEQSVELGVGPMETQF